MDFPLFSLFHSHIVEPNVTIPFYATISRTLTSNSNWKHSQYTLNLEWWIAMFCFAQLMYGYFGLHCLGWKCYIWQLSCAWGVTTAISWAFEAIFSNALLKFDWVEMTIFIIYLLLLILHMRFQGSRVTSYKHKLMLNKTWFWYLFKVQFLIKLARPRKHFLSHLVQYEDKSYIQSVYCPFG